MPSYHVYICDRCSRRTEGEFGPGWCEVSVMHGFAEDQADSTEPPEYEGYLLCQECAPRALKRLREAVHPAEKTPPTH